MCYDKANRNTQQAIPRAQEADIFRKQASRIEVKPGEDEINRRGHFIDIDDSWKALLICYINPLRISTLMFLQRAISMGRECNKRGNVPPSEARKKDTVKKGRVKKRQLVRTVLSVKAATGGRAPKRPLAAKAKACGSTAEKSPRKIIEDKTAAAKKTIRASLCSAGFS